MKPLKNQWRTVIVALSGIVALLAGYALTGHWPAAGAQFPAFVGGVGLCVSAVAAKAFGQHSADAKANAAS